MAWRAQVLGMELTASCEGGQRWTGRPPTPVYRAHSEHVSGASTSCHNQRKFQTAKHFDSL